MYIYIYICTHTQRHVCIHIPGPFRNPQTKEVEAERKPPAALESAFNSWVGASATLPPPAEEESEELRLGFRKSARPLTHVCP